jgi:hypothetical protein
MERTGFQGMAMNAKTSATPKLENFVRSLIVGIMLGCIALSLVELFELVVTDWNGTYIVVSCVLTALEANYSYRLAQTRFYTERPKFRAVELAMLFILLKIGSYVGDPWVDILADLQSWPRRPLNIIDIETLITFGIVLLSWMASTSTVRDLEQIGEPAGRDPHYIPPTEHLARRFFFGGVALLIITGVTRIGIVALLDLGRPSVPGLVLNILVYYVLGLVMMGQIHFLRLRKMWQDQKLTIADELPVHWVRYSLILIGLTALLAFLLPTRYIVGLLELVAAGVGILTDFFLLLFVLILLPFRWLFWLLSRLLGSSGPAPASSIPTPDPSPQAAAGPTPGWAEVLRSLLFWIATLGIVVYIVRSYLRDHPEILQALTALRPVRALRRWLAAVWQRLVDLVQAAGERFPRTLSLRRRRRERPGTWVRFFRLGALSHRERVLYYFLSTVRRAGQRGFPRRDAQTPYEYKDTLEPHLPDTQEEMTALTQAFVEARYSQQPFDRERDRQVRAMWKKVRAALRALKQTNTEQESKESDQ